MRRTEANGQMLGRYRPWRIGSRMLQLMQQEGLSLRTFSHLLQSCSVPPFGNILKYVSGADLSKTAEEAEKDEDFCIALGLLFLDFAVTAYQIAVVLKTDPVYLATGLPFRKDPVYPTTYPEGTESERLTRVRSAAAAIDYRGISRRICEMRSLRAMNVRQLAAAIRVSTSTVSAYENAGITKPQRFSFPVFHELCSALDVYPDYLMLGCSVFSLYNPFSDDPEIVYGYNGQFGYPAPPAPCVSLAESGVRESLPTDGSGENTPGEDYRWVSEKLGSLSAAEISLIKGAMLKWHPEWPEFPPGKDTP